MITPLESRPLGRTGLDITAIGLGTAPLASAFWGNDPATAVETVRAAVAAGIRFFDTAPLYGSGEAEERLGAGLASAEDLRAEGPLVVATKVGRTVVSTETGGRDVVADHRGEATRAQLEASLERLGRDHVDIVHVHDPEGDLDRAIEEQLAELVDLRRQGLIRAVSVGTNLVETALEFLDRTDPSSGPDVVMVAGRLTLLDRSAVDRLVPALEARDVPLIAAGVFNSGILARPVPGAWFNYAPADDRVVDLVQRLEQVCTDHGASLRAAAIQFPLRFTPVAAVVLGMSSPAEVRENVELASTPIPDALWGALDELVSNWSGTAH